MSDRLVTLARLPSTVQAHLLKGLLEGAGIDAFLTDEVMGTHYPGAVGVRLQVRAEDAARARLVLDSAHEAEDEGETMELEEDAELCPACGSTSFHYVDRNRLRCEACMHQWEQPQP